METNPDLKSIWRMVQREVPRHHEETKLLLEGTMKRLIEKRDFTRYIEFGCGYYSKFVKENPEFASEDFFEYIVCHNRACRDSGETHDIAKHEILRLAKEWHGERRVVDND